MQRSGLQNKPIHSYEAANGSNRDENHGKPFMHMTSDIPENQGMGGWRWGGGVIELELVGQIIREISWNFDFGENKIFVI